MKTPLFKLWQIQLFAIVFLLFACKDDNVVIPPDPEEPGILKLKFESRKVIEFRSIEDSKETGSLGEDEIEEHFGSRVRSFIPNEITISKDSTTFVKAGPLEEKFRTKWEGNDDLYLYDDNTKTWNFLGKRTDDVFLLSAAFFSKKVSARERVSTILGQAYALENFDTLIAQSKQYNLIWLKVEATYH
ncbi:hypothetical protein [Sphingobacterium gobiense]|uniref:Uncharacterized protein n=1 Tax=Sphingobacterium gobiense TaxID=1382456 RepID=A0A2S9JUX2_9SPHI|nr:hypothetical protein [Sphingobacterium gobiense]PRD57058.1 hypothetical protein C5749_07585 [Sphingobacterium gobiense]